MFWDIHPVIARGSLLIHHFKSTNLRKEEICPSSLIAAYKIFAKENKFQESCILNTLNHFMKNNTNLTLNLNNFKLLIHKPPLQPSLLPMKIQDKHSNNFTITDTTTTTKHWNDPDDTIYNISGITYFSSTISDTSPFNVISTSEANKISTFEEIPVYIFSL